MSSLSFRALLILGNDSLGVQISEKIKQELEGLPLEVDYVTDARRGITDFRDKIHQLIIIDDELPGTTGIQIIREIRKIVGGVTIIFLVKEKQEVLESGVEQLKLPIVNWREFLSRVKEVIPEELKAKFGFLKRDSLFFKKLERYCDNFIQSNELDIEFQKYKTNAPITVIPKYFDSNIDVQSSHELTSIDNREIDTREKFEIEKPNIKIELFTLLALGMLTFGVHFFDFFESDEIMSFKNIISLIMILSFAGFSSARIFDRFYLKIKREK